MSMTELLPLFNDEARCAQLLRQVRWPAGVRCPHCDSADVQELGAYQTHYRRYNCRTCCARSGQTRASFTDKTGTVFEGTKLPLRVWLLGLYLYKLGLSVNAACQELGVNYKTAKRINRLADLAVYEAFVKEAGNYDGQVELDEIYLTHKGQPQKVKRAGRAPRKRG